MSFRKLTEAELIERLSDDEKNEKANCDLI